MFDENNYLQGVYISHIFYAKKGLGALKTKKIAFKNNSSIQIHNEWSSSKPIWSFRDTRTRAYRASCKG